MEDNGGRDITLADILADKLNFAHESVDPAAYGIKRSRGSRQVRIYQSNPTQPMKHLTSTTQTSPTATGAATESVRADTDIIGWELACTDAT